MRKNRLILSLFSALLAASGPAFCQEPAATDKASQVGIEEQLGAQLPADLTFFSEDGSPVKLGSVINKPTILTLVYYECPAICGPLLNAVMALIDEMDLEPGRDYQVVSISFNELEGPELAARKKQNFLGELKKPIPDDAWRFFTGDKKNIAAVTDAAGFRYQRVESDTGVTFNHPATLIILSPECVITGYIAGISFLPEDVTLALTEAKAGKIRETRTAVPRGGLLSFCYVLDPVQGKKVLSVTRVAGTVILALAGVFLALVLILRWKPKAAGETEPPSEARENKEE